MQQSVADENENEQKHTDMYDSLLVLLNPTIGFHSGADDYETETKTHFLSYSWMNDKCIFDMGQ